MYTCPLRCLPGTVESPWGRRSWRTRSPGHDRRARSMCLGVPGRILSISTDGLSAQVDFFGVKKELRLDIVDVPVQVGDYVLNHVGFAIRRIPPEEVGETLAL